MGISMRHVVWCSATLSLGAFFYVLTMEPMDRSTSPRAAAIDQVPPRRTLLVNIRRHLGMGQLSPADRQADALIQNYPEDLDAIYFRTIVDRALGHQDRADAGWTMLDRATRTLESWPNRYTNTQIAYYRAWALVGIGQVEEGRAGFRQLADQIEDWASGNPEVIDNSGTQYNLACYRSMGDEPDRAIEHWDRAVALGYGENNSDNGWWMVDPDLESLHQDNRFWVIGARLLQSRTQDERVVEPAEIELEAAGAGG